MVWLDLGDQDISRYPAAKAPNGPVFSDMEIASAYFIKGISFSFLDPASLSPPDGVENKPFSFNAAIQFLFPKELLKKGRCKIGNIFPVHKTTQLSIISFFS